MPADWTFDSARTRIRPALAADAAALHASRSHMPYDPQTRTLEETRQMLAGLMDRPAIDAPGWQQFTVEARDDARFLGDFGVNFDHPHPAQCELGFAFAPAARGQGLAAESLAVLAGALFARGRHRLTAVTDARNLPAQRLLERCRFRREAHFIQSWQQDGRWFDEVAYARLANE